MHCYGIPESPGRIMGIMGDLQLGICWLWGLGQTCLSREEPANPNLSCAGPTTDLSQALSAGMLVV